MCVFAVRASLHSTVHSCLCTHAYSIVHISLHTHISYICIGLIQGGFEGSYRFTNIYYLVVLISTRDWISIGQLSTAYFPYHFFNTRKYWQVENYRNVLHSAVKITTRHHIFSQLTWLDSCEKPRPNSLRLSPCLYRCHVRISVNYWQSVSHR